jgi:hypothetical protein
MKNGLCTSKWFGGGPEEGGKMSVVKIIIDYPPNKLESYSIERYCKS